MTEELNDREASDRQLYEIERFYRADFEKVAHELGPHDHSAEEVRKMRRRVYRNLVDENPEYVKRHLCARRAGLAVTLMHHFQFHRHEAIEAAYGAMWWVEDATASSVSGGLSCSH